MAALGECGGDVGEFLSPRALGAEAARGLKSKTPSSLAGWFDFDSLPLVHWSDGAGAGTEVDPDIVRWWVVLADRLKNPNGRGDHRPVPVPAGDGGRRRPGRPRGAGLDGAGHPPPRPGGESRPRPDRRQAGLRLRPAVAGAVPSSVDRKSVV